MPVTLYINVPLQCYCSLHIDTILLHISLKHYSRFSVFPDFQVSKFPDLWNFHISTFIHTYTNIPINKHNTLIHVSLHISRNSGFTYFQNFYISGISIFPEIWKFQMYCWQTYMSFMYGYTYVGRQAWICLSVFIRHSEVSMYVWVHAWTCVCIYVCMHDYIHLSMYINRHVSLHVYVCMHIRYLLPYYCTYIWHMLLNKYGYNTENVRHKAIMLNGHINPTFCMHVPKHNQLQYLLHMLLPCMSHQQI